MIHPETFQWTDQGSLEGSKSKALEVRCTKWLEVSEDGGKGSDTLRNALGRKGQPE